jgi:hypothetical protein
VIVPAPAPRCCRRCRIAPRQPAAASPGSGSRRPCPGRFHPQLRDQNRRDIGKSHQSMWTDVKMETARSQQINEHARDVDRRHAQRKGLPAAAGSSTSRFTPFYLHGRRADPPQQAVACRLLGEGAQPARPFPSSIFLRTRTGVTEVNLSQYGPIPRRKRPAHASSPRVPEARKSVAGFSFWKPSRVHDASAGRPPVPVSVSSPFLCAEHTRASHW